MSSASIRILLTVFPVHIITTHDYWAIDADQQSKSGYAFANLKLQISPTNNCGFRDHRNLQITCHETIYRESCRFSKNVLAMSTNEEVVGALIAKLTRNCNSLLRPACRYYCFSPDSLKYREHRHAFEGPFHAIDIQSLLTKAPCF